MWNRVFNRFNRYAPLIGTFSILQRPVLPLQWDEFPIVRPHEQRHYNQFGNINRVSGNINRVNANNISLPSFNVGNMNQSNGNMNHVNGNNSSLSAINFTPLPPNMQKDAVSIFNRLQDEVPHSRSVWSDFLKNQNNIISPGTHWNYLQMYAQKDRDVILDIWNKVRSGLNNNNGNNNSNING